MRERGRCNCSNGEDTHVRIYICINTRKTDDTRQTIVRWHRCCYSNANHKKLQQHNLSVAITCLRSLSIFVKVLMLSLTCPHHAPRGMRTYSFPDMTYRVASLAEVTLDLYATYHINAMD